MGIGSVIKGIIGDPSATIKGIGGAFNNIKSGAEKIKNAYNDSGITEKLSNAMNTANDVGNKVFTDVAPGAAKGYQKWVPKQLNPTIGFAAAGIYVGGKALKGSFGVYEDRKFGGGGIHGSGEGLSGMVGGSNSPLVSDLADGRYDARKMGRAGRLSRTEADGQLVMALHQLRRG